MIDIKQILSNSNIPFVDRGPNVAQGNVNIKCPWCGDDPSQHMGISLSTGWYGCWRNAAHRGKNLAALLAAVLGVSRAEAAQIAGLTGLQPDRLDEAVQALSQHTRVLGTDDYPAIKFPTQFRPLSPEEGDFFSYIMRRGFTYQQALGLCDVYRLRCAKSGRWRGRVIVPVYMPESKLVSWTGRTILGHEPLRYMSLSGSEDKAKRRGDPVGVAVNRTLWNYGELVRDAGNTKVVYICEGPFDAIKVDYFGWEHGIAATCLFTLAMSTEQFHLLTDLSEVYGYELRLLLDNSAYAQAMRLAKQLSALNFGGVYVLPEHIKDPGEMTEEDVRLLAEGVLCGNEKDCSTSHVLRGQ